MRGRRFGDHHLQHRSNQMLAVALLALAILVSGAIFAYQALKRPGDVHNEAAIENFKPQKPPPPKEPKTVNWPFFGLNPARTRYLPVKGIKPPFDKLWRFTDRPLLEFPPIYVGGKLYFVNNSGYAYALDADTGKELWKRRIGRLNASSPTYYRHRLYIVYFGCEDGNLYALSTNSGDERWTTQLGGPIKSAPAYYGGRIYVGDYGGYMNAVDAKSGEVAWQSGSLGPGFGA